jgi:hypothetical protein
MIGLLPELRRIIHKASGRFDLFTTLLTERYDNVSSTSSRYPEVLLQNRTKQSTAIILIGKKGYKTFTAVLLTNELNFNRFAGGIAFAGITSGIRDEKSFHLQH